MRVRALGLLAAVALVAVSSAMARESELVEALAFSPGSSASLDLYLPERAVEPVPLLVFVHSRFWSAGTRSVELAHRFARPLQRAGAAVAIVRPRDAEQAPHPAAAEDVAAAVAYLLARSDELGLDRRRVVLSGHASGAHLAALVALDPRFLSAHGRSPADLRGVALISGVYDLEEEALASQEQRERVERAFGVGASRREASPLRHARADAATLVALAAQRDAPGAREAASALAEALRAAGHPAAEALFIGGRDHWSQLDLQDDKNPLRQHLLALLELDQSWGSIEDVLATRRFWRDPPLSTRGFWESGLPVERYQPDERFLHTLNLLFAKPGRPQPLRPAHYHAIDLIDFVRKLSQQRGESGDFLTVTNVRGEQMVWRLSELERWEPRIVIGLDDERELFRLTDTYHTLRRYTWKDADPHIWVLARPLGAFVHFASEPPARLEPKLLARFGLLPEAARSLVIDELRCTSCHQLRGVGARAAHLRARDGERVGGFALPLEEYPPGVWRRYCFEQSQVAAEIGASVVALGDRAQLLFDLVEAERVR